MNSPIYDAAATRKLISRLDRESVIRVKSPMTDLGREQTSPTVVFSGSFNPLHAGHREMASLASARLNQPVWLELSLANADKPSLSNGQLANRLNQDFGNHGVLLTRAARFDAKARLFPAAMFVVGADTIERIDQRRFYDSDQDRDQALQCLVETNCRFLVFGRQLASPGYSTGHDEAVEHLRRGSIDGEFRSSNALISESLRNLCTFVDRSDFESRLSSTQIRERLKNQT